MTRLTECMFLIGTAAMLARAPAQADGLEVRLDGRRAAAGVQTVDFAANALPEQITLRASPRELPLELRREGQEPDAMVLQWLGRGPRLVAPMRLEAMVEGEWVESTVVSPAEPEISNGAVRAEARLKTGTYDVRISCAYRGGGEILVDVKADGGGAGDRLSLMIEPRGPVDMARTNLPPGAPGTVSRELLNPLLAADEGVVWDSAEEAPGGIRQLYAGSADAGFSWLGLDLPELAVGASRIVLERDELRRIQWRVTLITGPRGKASVAFLVHPFRHRSAEARRRAWLDWPEDLEALPFAAPALFRTRDGPKGAPREGFAGYLAGAPYATHAVLRGNACAEMLSHRKDCISLYPLALFRALAGLHTGLTLRLEPNVRELADDYEPGMDRQVLGRALLHDIGVDIRGLNQPAEFLRVTRALREFGFFEDDGLTEFIPYWRAGEFVRYGGSFDPSSSFNLTTSNPSAGTYVSLYRRPHGKGKKKGVQVLFVIVNEKNESVRQRLSVLDVERIFGDGPGRLHGAGIMRELDYGRVPEDSDWGMKAVLGRPAYHKTGLLDLEMRGLVRSASNKGQAAEIYGPIHVPRHDFRLLLARGMPGRRRR
ncbi:MAG: hypothetical protein R6V03_02165 [Kiritimatiellia bacterium]